jgi:hypothetical protein
MKIFKRNDGIPGLEVFDNLDSVRKERLAILVNHAIAALRGIAQTFAEDERAIVGKVLTTIGGKLFSKLTGAYIKGNEIDWESELTALTGKSEFLTAIVILIKQGTTTDGT